ncbi:MAG TPA: hypothetical protein DHW02_06035 [Ktedonobacter sp.]|nr:hypothetical protein [Ktedonobacter sp.]
MSSKILCMVTIHGIGFEQPPAEGVEGYADDLHANLYEALGELLSDDPTRQDYQHGVSVPIYVQSAYPPGTHCREVGMSRLGKWDLEHIGLIDASQAPLAKEGASIAHVALVYSQIEGQGPQPGAMVITGGMSGLSLAQGHYAHVLGLLRTLFLDAEPLWNHLLEHHPQQTKEATPSLRIRQDKGYKPPRVPSQPSPSDGFMAILRQLENDVAAYICHNEMREQVRSFVLDALLRLAYREDVAGIIINAHSNGTVVALDVLRSLPPFAAKKIRAFITAGSPLRKYATLFTWGEHMATVPMIETWKNFWDERDPVADPLKPSIDWLRGTKPTKKQLTGLFRSVDPETGNVTNLIIEDIPVDNLKYSKGGGMQAHNYWDNQHDFIKPLAMYLKELVAQEQDASQEKVKVGV